MDPHIKQERVRPAEMTARGRESPEFDVDMQEFSKLLAFDYLLDRPHSGEEAIILTDHQRAVERCRLVYQLLCFGHGSDEWLLHEHVLLGPEGGAHDVAVLRAVCRHQGRVYFLVIDGVRDRGIALTSRDDTRVACRSECFVTCVDAGDELHLRDFRQYLGCPVQPPCSHAYLKKCWHL